jgi:Ca-activated chloride channel family protein
MTRGPDEPRRTPPPVWPELDAPAAGPTSGSGPERYELGRMPSPPAPPPSSSVPVSPFAPPSYQVPPPIGTPPPPPPARKAAHRYRRRWPIIGGIALCLLITAGVTVVVGERLSGKSNSTAAAHCASVKTTLHVTAEPDIAPVLRTAAAGLAQVKGGCAAVQVTSQDPALTSQSLVSGGQGSAAPTAGPTASGSPTSGPPAATGAPDVWVPASTAWLAFAQAAGARQFPTQAPSLARSPVVLVVPTSMAGDVGPKTTWADLIAAEATGHGPTFSMPNALSSTVGILSVVAVRTAMGRANSDAGIAQMRALTLRNHLASANADVPALFDKLAAEPPSGGRDVGVFPATEQGLWAYQKGQVGAQVSAVYPADGVVEADYPLALASKLGSDSNRKALADALVSAFHAKGFAGTLAAHGLRPGQQVTSQPQVAPEAAGIATSYPRPAPLAASDLATAVAIWEQYKVLPFQVLILVDASASMNDQVTDAQGHKVTKVALVRQAGVQAAQLYGSETSVALWQFNTANPKAAETPVVPFGPIDGPLAGVTRRAAMEQAAQQFSAPKASGTPLFQSVLDGEATMQKLWNPQAFTMIALISDGKDEDSTFSMNAQQFLTKLKAQADPKKPVPVYSVGFGKDADMASLTAISKATGGQAINSVNAADLASAIAKIFLAAHQPH